MPCKSIIWLGRENFDCWQDRSLQVFCYEPGLVLGHQEVSRNGRERQSDLPLGSLSTPERVFPQVSHEMNLRSPSRGKGWRWIWPRWPYNGCTRKAVISQLAIHCLYWCLHKPLAHQVKVPQGSLGAFGSSFQSDRFVDWGRTLSLFDKLENLHGLDSPSVLLLDPVLALMSQVSP